MSYFKVFRGEYVSEFGKPATFDSWNYYKDFTNFREAIKYILHQAVDLTFEWYDYGIDELLFEVFEKNGSLTKYDLKEFNENFFKKHDKILLSAVEVCLLEHKDKNVKYRLWKIEKIEE